MSKFLYEGPDGASANIPDEDFESRIAELIEDAVTSAVEDAIEDAVEDAVKDAVEDAVRETMEEIIDDIINGEKYLKRIYLLAQDKGFIMSIKSVSLHEDNDNSSFKWVDYRCEHKENAKYVIIGENDKRVTAVLGWYEDKEAAKTEMENIFKAITDAQSGGSATYELR